MFWRQVQDGSKEKPDPPLPTYIPNPHLHKEQFIPKDSGGLKEHLAHNKG